MFNLASSLLYNSLFQQNNNGEHEYKGSAALKPPTYTMGFKGIPDDVVWALSSVNLEQYDLPEWNITLTKTGVNLNMVWKQANDPNHIDQSEPSTPSTGCVIKKLGIPVSKLIGEQNTVSHRNDEKLDLQNYVNRMQPMQSILTIRPENGLPGHLPNGVSGHHVGNGHVPEQSAEHSSHRVKANSIESPPQLSNKSEDELIDPVDSDGQTNGHEHNGHIHNGEHSGLKDNGSVRTSVITENIDNVKAEMSDKMEVNEGQGDRYDDNESEEIDPGNDNLQIDESEDVDVTEPDNKMMRMDPQSEHCCNNEDGQSTHSHSHSQKPEIANWNLPERRKSPIEQLLERHNLGHISQNLNQAAQSNPLNQPTQNGSVGQIRPGQFQSALGIAPTTLQSLYANPVFHQSLRTSVLQSRGLNPQTLPLLLPQQNSILNSQPKNLFLTTNHANGLSQTTHRPMVSPVGRSPIPTQPCQTAPIRGDVKNGKDKGPFSCSLCGRTFSLRGNLLRHERIHRGDKPFRCRFCNKAFIQRTDVLAHERVHTGEKPFACQYCGKRFPRRSTMKEHEKSFCRARVAFEENRKLKGDEQDESNSGEHSPVSVSPPPSSTQEAAAGLLAISGQIISTQKDSTGLNSENSTNSSNESSSSSKTTSPEHPSSQSNLVEKKTIDASDFSVKAVIAN